MHPNLKFASKHSSSSGSLKFINLNDFDHCLHDVEPRKDLFDILLEDGPLALNSLPSLTSPKSNKMRKY